MKNPFTKAEWDGLTDEVRKAWTDAATLSGGELTFDAPEPDAVQKSLGECTDEMVKALADVKETLEDGGAIARFSAEQLGAMDEAFKSHTDAVTGVRSEMAKSIEVLGNHNEMIKANSDMVKALDARIVALESCLNDSMNKIMEAVRQPGMVKSVVAMDDVAIAPKPGEGVTEDNLAHVDAAEACDAIKKAFDAETDGNKRLILKKMYDSTMFGGFNGTKEQLEARIKSV